MRDAQQLTVGAVDLGHGRGPVGDVSSNPRTRTRSPRSPSAARRLDDSERAASDIPSSSPSLGTRYPARAPDADGWVIGRALLRSRHLAHASTVYSSARRPSSTSSSRMRRTSSTAARMLVEFFESYDQRERIASQLIDLEHKGDGISHDIGHRLEKTFVTPFDREDIQELISRLDDVLDFIEEVADTCILYKIEEPTPTAASQAAIIVQQCEEIVRGLQKLKGFKGVAAALDRGPSARERGRSHRSPRDRRPLHERHRCGPHHQVEGRVLASSRTRSTPARTSRT